MFLLRSIPIYKRPRSAQNPLIRILNRSLSSCVNSIVFSLAKFLRISASFPSLSQAPSSRSTLMRFNSFEASPSIGRILPDSDERDLLDLLKSQPVEKTIKEIIREAANDKTHWWWTAI